MRNWKIAQESPVETIRKSLPKGDGKWRGFASVYRRISKACEEMARRGHHLSEFHVETMAILGCGHEETMKARLLLLYESNWIS